MSGHTYSLRMTWPDAKDDWLVIDEHGDTIARMYFTAGAYPPRWSIHVGAHQLPVWDGRFNAAAPDFEAAKQKVKELWPLFRAHWSDEEYEKAKRDTEVYTDPRFRR